MFTPQTLHLLEENYRVPEIGFMSSKAGMGSFHCRKLDYNFSFNRPYPSRYLKKPSPLRNQVIKSYSVIETEKSIHRRRSGGKYYIFNWNYFSWEFIF